MGWNPEDHASPEVKAAIKTLDASASSPSSPMSVDREAIARQIALGESYKFDNWDTLTKESKRRYLETADAILALAPTTPTDGDVGEMLAIADRFDAGLEKMIASGYEEFGPEPQRQHRLIIEALRGYARSSAVTASNEQRGNDLVTVIAQRDAAEAWLAEAVEVLQLARKRIEYLGADGARHIDANEKYFYPPIDRVLNGVVG